MPWLFIWQGLDFTDQGYLLTLYRCFLRSREAAGETGSIWLTTLIGGVWDLLLGKLGVLSMRALWALCMSLGLFWVFRLIRRSTSETFAAIATLGASLFLSDRRETWFSYNTSSSLLWVGLAVCLTLGLVEKRRGQLVAAGVLIALLPMARFPNLVGASLLATPGLAALVFAERRDSWLKETAQLILGVIAGLAGVFLLMLALGHTGLYVASIRELFAPSAAQSGYGMDALLSNFIKDESLALGWGLGVCVVGLGLARVLVKLPALVAWLCAVALAGVGAYYLAGPDEQWRYVVPGVAYWVLGAVALGLGRCSFEQRLLAFVALTIAVLAPLGSNNGIKNAHMGLWLAVPFLLALVATLRGSWLAGQGPKLALLGALVLAGEGAHRGATYTYRDSKRSTLVASVGDPQLLGQFTTAARAKSVAEVLGQLQQRVAPGEYLLAYDGTTLLPYLTRTRPYLNRAWLMGAQSSDEVRKLAAQAPARTGCLPVVVTSRFSTRGFDWPTKNKRLEDREPERGIRAVLKELLRSHHYTQKWRNGFFEIWEPPSAGRVVCR